MDKINQTLNDVIKEKLFIKDDNIKEVIKKRISEGNFSKYSSLNMGNYLDNLEKLSPNSKDLFDLTKEYYKFNDNEALEIKRILNKDEQLEIHVNVRSIKNGVVILSDNPLLSWVDKFINNNIFERKVGMLTYFYDQGNIIKKEASYNYPNLRVEKIDLEFNAKIGSIDFETFGCKDNGLGTQEVYAGGWAFKDYYKAYYLGNNENSNNLVFRLFEDLFSQDTDGYTFYIHNLGRFDSVFLIKSLYNKEGYKLDITWKDNAIISIIIHKEGKKIYLLDSMRFVNVKLYDLLNSLNCSIQKGVFPHKFMNVKTLYYSGNIPESKYFFNIDKNFYNFLKSKFANGKLWNAKEESLKYLESDVKGLLEAMIKLNDRIYNKYNLQTSNGKIGIAVEQ